MTLGSRLLIVKVSVRFGFNERKRLIRVFGLRSGSVRRPGFYAGQLITLANKQ